MFPSLCFSGATQVVNAAGRQCRPWPPTRDGVIWTRVKFDRFEGCSEVQTLQTVSRDGFNQLESEA